MIINFNDITYYYLTCNNELRKKHIINEFEDYKLVEVNPIMGIEKLKSGSSGFSRILDLACINQDRTKPFQPFAIFEDDVKKNREFPQQIEIPDDADILYIGLTTWGTINKPYAANNSVCYKNIDDNIIRVYNMLALHGIVICSIRGLLTFQKCLNEDFFKNRGWDISIASAQPYINAYALKNPLVYQYSKLKGEEESTKINYINKQDKIIPNAWINKTNISILTLGNK